MTKSKNTKRALLVSVLSMLLCLTMFIGSTFAWFTDTVASGKNKIIAGNLDIELQKKDGTPLSNDPLFEANIKWEPGQVHYRELKLVNKGTLAAEYTFYIPDDVFDFNYVLEPTGEVTDDGKVIYTNTERQLLDVIRFAVYMGNFEELMDELNETVENASSMEPRDLVKAALQLGLIEGQDLGFTDPNYPPLPRDVLDPEEAQEFTIIAYWAFEDDWIFEPDEGGFVLCDDDYNLKNGLEASKFTYQMPAPEGDAFIITSDAVDEDGLYIEFDIRVIARQTPYEKDSFDTSYDKDALYGLEPGVVPPELNP